MMGIKEIIINKINNTDDVEFLEAISDLLDASRNKKPIEFSEDEKNKILSSIEQYKKGNFISHGDLMKKAKSEWLK
jgi:hypothetical protein